MSGTSQNPLRHPSWLNKVCTTRKDSESDWLAKGNLETNPITIKPETASHMAELFSWVPLPYYSPSGCPFPIKSLALSACVSPQTLHFWVLDKSPVSGPGKGSPFLQHKYYRFWLNAGLSLFCVTGNSQFLLLCGRSVIIIITHNGLPRRILPLCLTVKLNCLCSENWQPIDCRKE